MGYGYSYGYGYGSGYSYSYGYASPPPPDPTSSSPSSQPPLKSSSLPPSPLAQTAYPSPPPPSSPSPSLSPPPPSPPSPSLSPPPPPLPCPSLSSPPPSSPPPPPLSTSPPPALQPIPSSPPPPPPTALPPPPPPEVVKPRVSLYYSPPPPIQQTTPPPSSAPLPSLPPVNTEPYNYISPPPPPQTIQSPPPSTPPPVPVPAAEPTPLPSSPPPPVPTTPPPLPLVPVPPPVEPPVSPPTSSPVAIVYTPPAPKHRPPSPPPPHRTTTRPGAVNPSNNSPSQNIVISREAAAAIVVVAGLVTLSFVGAAFWFVKQRRRPEAEDPIRYPPNFMPSPTVGSQLSGSRGIETSVQRSPAFPGGKYSSSSYGYPSYTPSEAGLGVSKLWFTYEDLCIFTNGFSQQNLLGEGGFGCVYKGSLPDGREVAVKQLRVGSGQGEREFKAEVDIISRVHHRHLVSLVGYCISDNERMLVYHFVPNNTLYYHLHGNSGTALSWRTRLKIAAGAARGIAYLHEDCHPRIIHRDIKSSNILLDNNFEAQVSDFGLARLAMDANSHVTTRVMGTFGYLAPEYASSGKLTAKSDVYSFGVVLLELITGRKPVDSSQPLGDESLVEWARPYLMRALENRDFGELLDPRLENKFVEAEMHRMIEAAAACVRHSASMRPRMSQVVRSFDSLLSDTNLSNGLPPGQSEIFDEPQTEEIRMFQMREFGDCSSETTSQADSSRRHRGNL